MTNLNHLAVDLGVGQIVKDWDGAAIFAASFGELQAESLTIERLLKEGHELALVYQESQAFPATFKGTSQYLHNCLEYCQWRFNYQQKLVVVSSKKPKARVFKDLVITSPDGERVYYDNRLHGWELVSYHWKHFWNKVIDWFINNL